MACEAFRAIATSRTNDQGKPPDYAREGEIAGAGAPGAGVNT